MEREACVCDHGYERSDLCAEIIIIIVDPMLLPSGNPFKCHEAEVWSLQPMIPPKRFDIFPPDSGMLKRSRCVQIFLIKSI